MKKITENVGFQWLEILVGLLMCTAAYRMYLIPNDVAPGGFTGVGQLVNSLTGWPVGMVALALNVPLFALSLKSLGLRFGARSLFASVALSFMLDYLPMGAVTDDPMLAAVFGGVLGGAGFGMILRGNATTGGSDMLGRLINEHIPVFRVGVATFAVDTLVIVASGFVFDATSAMFALVSAFLMSKLMDVVLEGANTAKAYFIVSGKSEEIARRVMKEMEHGVTQLRGKGMYSGEDKPVLLCVINRLETMHLRQIVAQTDPSAFMIGTDVKEALGEGFTPHK